MTNLSPLATMLDVLDTHTVSDQLNIEIQVARVVQSAAYAAECPMAALFLLRDAHYEIVGYFGFEAPITLPINHFLLSEIANGDSDVLVINDLTREHGRAEEDKFLFGNDLPPVRFLAGVRVGNDEGLARGVLVVADTLPQAGLSAAKSYVLRTHAAQISLRLDLDAFRKPLERLNEKTESRFNAERLRLLESVVVNANDAILITKAEPIELPGPEIVYCNAAFTRTTGYTEAEILGLTPRILQSSKTDRTALDRLHTALSHWKPIEVELLNTRKDGTEFWVELSIVPVANEKGWFTHWVSVQRDISDRKASEETATRARIAEAQNMTLETEIVERRRVEAQLLYAAFHDDLTKLHNRAFFMDRLALALHRMKSESGFSCAVLFMDLNRFKLVNDSLGHRAGDLLLMEVANRLRGCVRSQDTLARVGGDEFALLIEGVGDTDSAVITAKTIIDALHRPLWLGGQEIFSSCSVGVVLATSHYHLPEEVLRDADIAMYRAKRKDTDNSGYAVFATSMRDAAVEALEMQTDLQNAVSRSEFYLEYQPICSAITQRITGVEALIRWQHPQRGIVPPIAFISLAEDTGLIREIGRWVLQEACTQMRQWQDRYPGLTIRLSINTSSDELRDASFISHLQKTLAETGLDPTMLQIEITESVFIDNAGMVDGILADIRALGVRIALDDFGTGYSSLGYLDRYPMDTIKIDRSFVTKMLTRQRTLAIVETIVRLGHVLSLDIVAEGVEDEAQLRSLAATGCSFVQGYLLGRPMSAAAFDAMLGKQFAPL